MASVLGHAEAEKQLQLVIDDDDDDADPTSDGPDLRSAFYWGATPQGWDYWFDVSAEIENLKA